MSTMRIVFALIMTMFICAAVAAQQNQTSEDQPSDKTKPAATKEKKDKKEQTLPTPGAPDKAPDTTSKPSESKPDSNEATEKEEHYDVSEAAPTVTHHQISVSGKSLNYTATTGR